jgi:hypothetical protein
MRWAPREGRDETARRGLRNETARRDWAPGLGAGTGRRDWGATEQARRDVRAPAYVMECP